VDVEPFCVHGSSVDVPIGADNRVFTPRPPASCGRHLARNALTDDDIQQLADEAEPGYDPSPLRPRGGRSRIGSAPAEVVPVRLDPELRAAVEARQRRPDVDQRDHSRGATTVPGRWSDQDVARPG
jgi:hypothetical protein